MPRRRPDGGVATPRWVVAFAVAVSVAVHIALIWGNFAIYRVDLVPKKGERFLMVGQLVKGLPDQIPIPAAPARVPVSSAPVSRAIDTLSDGTKPRPPMEESEARQADKATEGIPTPTPSVLSWDMGESNAPRRPVAATVRQGGPGADGIPVLDYRKGVVQPPGSVPILQEPPQASIPKRSLPQAPAVVPQKAPRVQKKWSVSIDSYLHEELASTRRSPKLIYISDIPFPEQAKREGIEDHILVEVRVNTDGRAVSWRFARGKAIFRDNVVKGLKGAEFEPAKDEGGRKIEGEITLDIHFFLQEER
jgi:TonB family protein